MRSEPQVIWSANPGSIALRSLFPRARFVFQVVDYYPAFSGDSVRALERADYYGADHIFVIGETLKRYIVGQHAVPEGKVTVLGQGVFENAYRCALPAPDDVKDLPRPIGVWIGVLSKADPVMFEAAARALAAHGGSLVLIGPSASWVEELRARCSNVRVLGPRSPEASPAYLLASDIGLMLYDRTRQAVYKGQNPLKLYEYCAAGLPTISTPHDEYAFMDPPVITVSDPLELASAVAAALERRVDLAGRARAFAAEHSWERAYGRARQVIAGLLSH